MAFTTGKDVSVGDATRETDHDNLSTDQDWLQANADVGHDFDTALASGAGGKHEASKLALQWPSARESATDENCQRVIFVDLDDPTQMWDYEAFMQQIQRTSWHDELGDPPVHGLMWTTEDGNKIIWWNRETGAIYMEFESGTQKAFYGNGGHVALRFLDGIIYASDPVSTYGLDVVDLLRDRSYFYHTGGFYSNHVPLDERNGTNSYTVIDSGLALVNAQVNDLAACRDIDLVDEFGRPKHWWAAATDGGCSVYNPVDDAIYDSTNTDDFDYLDLLDDGTLVTILDWATRDDVYLRRSIFGIDADGWAEGGSADQGGSWSTGSSDGEDLAWVDADIIGPAVLLPRSSWANEAIPQIWLGNKSATGVGAYVLHPSAKGDNTAQAGKIRLHEDYASPYMKGDIKGAWPLHSTADVSEGGLTLTNNNTVTFSDGGPAGSYATLVAASSMSLTNTGLSTTSNGTICAGCWFKSGGVASAGYMLAIQQTAPGHYLDVLLNTDGTVRIRSGFQPSTLDVTTSGNAYDDDNWHHIVAQLDGINGSGHATTYSVWIDGVKVLSGSLGSASQYLTLNRMSIGHNYAAGANYFDGEVGGAFFTETPMTEREVRAEYVRGLRRIESTVDTNDTIADNDVAAIAADPHGRYVAVAGDDKTVTIFDEFAVPISTDTYQGTTIRDVAIKSMPGGVDPHLVIGGSDEIETVFPDTRLT